MLDKEEDTKALFIWESKNQDMSLSYKEINAYLKCRDICFLEEYSYVKCFWVLKKKQNLFLSLKT